MPTCGRPPARRLDNQSRIIYSNDKRCPAETASGCNGVEVAACCSAVRPKSRVYFCMPANKHNCARTWARERAQANRQTHAQSRHSTCKQNQNIKRHMRRSALRGDVHVHVRRTRTRRYEWIFEYSAPHAGNVILTFQAHISPESRMKHVPCL